MHTQSEQLAIASFDLSSSFSNEASLYGTPAGLAWLADLFSDVASGKTNQHHVAVESDGPLLDVGTSINISHEENWTRVAQIAQVKTMQLLLNRRDFHGSEELEPTESIEQCGCRRDGAFAAAYPDYTLAPTLVFMGNSLLHWLYRRLHQAHSSNNVRKRRGPRLVILPRRSVHPD